MKINLTWENEDGEEFSHSFPAKNEVCSRCDGFGTHLHPDIGNHGYSLEEFNESFDDDEKQEYFRHGGMYDVSCNECHGKNVILVVDEEALSEDDKKLYEEYLEHVSLMARYNAIDADERRMGC